MEGEVDDAQGELGLAGGEGVAIAGTDEDEVAAAQGEGLAVDGVKAGIFLNPEELVKIVGVRATKAGVDDVVMDVGAKLVGREVAERELLDHLNTKKYQKKARNGMDCCPNLGMARPYEFASFFSPTLLFTSEALSPPPCKIKSSWP